MGYFVVGTFCIRDVSWIEHFVAGTFCNWDILLLGILCFQDVFYLGCFVFGTFCGWDVLSWDCMSSSAMYLERFVFRPTLL